MSAQGSEAGNRTPLEIVFVRHGESVGNVATKAAKLGDTSFFTTEFMNTHSSEWELTPKGIDQAIAAGAWIRNNIHGGKFDGYFASTYRRARQTAGYLHLPEGEKKPIWKLRDYLREHDWGILDVMTDEKRREKYPDIMARKDVNPFYFPALSGESMAALTLRARVIIDTLYRDHSGQTAIVVTHGNTMWAERCVLEGMTPEEYLELDKSNDPFDKINNCQILQYSRINPQTGETGNKLSWMRSVCPWDLKRSENKWVQLMPKKFSNNQLISS